MTTLRKVWAWVRTHAWLLGTALVAVLGAGLVATYWRTREGRLRDELAVAKAKQRVASLDARREAVEARDVEAQAKIEEIRQERARIQREALALEHDVAAMSDEEVEYAFRQLF